MKNIYLVIVLASYTIEAGDFYQPAHHDTGNFVHPFSKQKRCYDSWISEDKAVHVIGSFMSTILIGQLSMRSYEPSVTRSNYVSAGVVFTLGLAKEMNDHRKKNNFFSWKDLSTNILGITLAIIVLAGNG